MRETVLRGRLWALTDNGGQLYDDVDTDQIYHNRHLHVTELGEMGQYALGNLAGWEDFSRGARPGDVIMAGRNFGAGSSRQHAVDCFISLGIWAVIAESLGAIYKRNAINSGLAVVEAPGLRDVASHLVPGEGITVDLTGGTITMQSGLTIAAKPFSAVQMDIYLAGDLFAYGRSTSQAAASAGSLEETDGSHVR